MRERERESVCVRAKVRGRVCVCVRERVCEREKVCVREREARNLGELLSLVLLLQLDRKLEHLQRECVCV